MFPHSRHHLAEPEDAQRHDDCVGAHEGHSDPSWSTVLKRKRRLRGGVVVQCERRLICLNRCPHVTKEGECHVGTPEQATTGEGDHEHDAVNHLDFRPSQAHLAEEPMDVHEWRRKFY